MNGSEPAVPGLPNEASSIEAGWLKRNSSVSQLDVAETSNCLDVANQTNPTNHHPQSQSTRSSTSGSYCKQMMAGQCRTRRGEILKKIRRRQRRQREIRCNQIGRKRKETRRFEGAKLNVGSSRLLVLSCLLLLSLLTCTHFRHDGAAFASSPVITDYDVATFYKAPMGARVRLSCNGSHWHDDSVSLVLWFKGTQSEPIYTIDARQQRPPSTSGAPAATSGDLMPGARHHMVDSYRGRAKFVSSVTPSSSPYLELAELEPDDQAEYRCRLDYRNRPRENVLAILFVLVAPKSVQIVEVSNGHLAPSLGPIYGPLSDSSDLKLMCLARGGRPAPALRWRIPGTSHSATIDDSYLTLNDFYALQKSGSLLRNQRPSGLIGEPARPNGTTGSGPDSGFEQLASLYADWSSWPEFQAFTQRQQQQMGSNLHQLSADPTSRRMGQHAKPVQASSTLMSINPTESVISSLNVLILPRIGSQSQVLAPEDSAQVTGNWTQREGAPSGLLASIECEASNLHYDIRSLLHIFAPPSLFGQPEVLKQSQTKPPSNHEDSLGLAIQAAIELSSHAGDSIPLLGHPPASTNSGTTSAGNWSASNWKFLGLNQQLWRSHELAQRLANESTSEKLPASPDFLVRQRLTLEIYTKPTSVSIGMPPRPISANQPSEFVCQTSGSHPRAHIAWLKNGQPLDPKLVQQHEELTGNATLSRLTVKLAPEDHGATLVCRASNEQLARLLLNSGRTLDSVRPGSQDDEPSGLVEPEESVYIEDSRTLTVHYAPRVKLELGTRMLSSSMPEGKDIYFVCQTDAQPPVKEILWLHNELPVNQSSSERIIISNSSLVLQRVQRHQRGHYACLASNSEGLGESNRIELRVLPNLKSKKDAPICSPPSLTSSPSSSFSSSFVKSSEPEVSPGPAILKPVEPDDSKSWKFTERLVRDRPRRFLCQVQADPAQVEFSWYLNNSHSERRLLSRINSTSVSQPSTATPTIRTATSGTGRDHRGDEASKPQQQQQLPGQPEASYSQAGPNLVQSRLTWTPSSHLDFGQIYCLARNEQGEQQTACAYSIQELPASADSSQFGSDSNSLPFLEARERHSANSANQEQTMAASGRQPGAGSGGQPLEGAEQLDCQALENQASAGSLQVVCPGALDRPGPHHFELKLVSVPDGELLASLSSGPLEEPIFGLINLPMRESGRFELLVSEQLSANDSLQTTKRRTSGPISIITSGPQFPVNGHEQQQPEQHPDLPIQVVTEWPGGSSLAGQSSQLLSSLLMTRSTNSPPGGRKRTGVELAQEEWTSSAVASQANNNNKEQHLSPPALASQPTGSTTTIGNQFKWLINGLQDWLLGRPGSGHTNKASLISNQRFQMNEISGFVSAATGKSSWNRAVPANGQGIDSIAANPLFWSLGAIMLLSLTLVVLIWIRHRSLRSSRASSSSVNQEVARKCSIERYASGSSSTGKQSSRSSCSPSSGDSPAADSHPAKGEFPRASIDKEPEDQSYHYSSATAGDQRQACLSLVGNFLPRSSSSLSHLLADTNMTLPSCGGTLNSQANHNRRRTIHRIRDSLQMNHAGGQANDNDDEAKAHADFNQNGAIHAWDLGSYIPLANLKQDVSYMNRVSELEGTNLASSPVVELNELGPLLLATSGQQLTASDACETINSETTNSYCLIGSKSLSQRRNPLAGGYPSSGFLQEAPGAVENGTSNYDNSNMSLQVKSGEGVSDEGFIVNQLRHPHHQLHQHHHQYRKLKNQNQNYHLNHHHLHHHHQASNEPELDGLRGQCEGGEHVTWRQPANINQQPASSILPGTAGTSACSGHASGSGSTHSASGSAFSADQASEQPEIHFIRLVSADSHHQHHQHQTTGCFEVLNSTGQLSNNNLSPLAGPVGGGGPLFAAGYQFQSPDLSLSPALTERFLYSSPLATNSLNTNTTISPQSEPFTQTQHQQTLRSTLQRQRQQPELQPQQQPQKPNQLPLADNTNSSLMIEEQAHFM